MARITSNKGNITSKEGASAVVVSPMASKTETIIEEKIIEKVIEVPVEKIVEVEKIIEVPINGEVKVIDHSKEIKQLNEEIKRLEKLIESKGEETSDLIDGIFVKADEALSESKVTHNGLIFLSKQQIQVLKEQTRSAKIHFILGTLIFTSLMLHIIL